MCIDDYNMRVMIIFCMVTFLMFLSGIKMGNAAMR